MNSIETNQTEPTIDDLPELPFRKVLSYLSLSDRLKSRRVSKGWRNQIDSFKVESLCYSNEPREFIVGNRRLISGAFTQNLISSFAFRSFFDSYRQSILSNLKHLRLCDLRLCNWNRPALSPTLNSFARLQQLDIIRFGYFESIRENLELDLAMLNSIRLEEVNDVGKLTLNTPQLKNVRISNGSGLRLEFIAESVERLIVDCSVLIEEKNLKHLKYLQASRVAFGVLEELDQLKEFHLNRHSNVSALFEQKQRYGRTDLKIYLHGLLLNGPTDPAIKSLSVFGEEALRCLAENSSRLADEIPFQSELSYAAIEKIAPGVEVNILKRLTNLSEIRVQEPVRDIRRFLELLKSSDIQELAIWCDQQELLDQLPDHCAVQRLFICGPRPSDFRFLCRLNALVHLGLDCSIDAESLRNALEELEFLFRVEFREGRNVFRIQIDHLSTKEYLVSINFAFMKSVRDSNAAIELIFGEIEEMSKKRKIEE